MDKAWIKPAVAQENDDVIFPNGRVGYISRIYDDGTARVRFQNGAPSVRVPLNDFKV